LYWVKFQQQIVYTFKDVFAVNTGKAFTDKGKQPERLCNEGTKGSGQFEVAPYAEAGEHQKGLQGGGAVKAAL
jgi:hypothetical protein